MSQIRSLGHFGLMIDANGLSTISPPGADDAAREPGVVAADSLLGLTELGREVIHELGISDDYPLSTGGS